MDLYHALALAGAVFFGLMTIEIAAKPRGDPFDDAGFWVSAVLATVCSFFAAWSW